VFGLGSSLNTSLTTYCLVGVIAFTIAFEALTHIAERKLHGTPYMEMLSKVYKEMMIMGFISFGVFMAVQAGGVTASDTLIAFEFAHILVFFSALLFVLSALGFIIFSARLKRIYEMCANRTADQLLTEYSLVRKSRKFHGLSWISGVCELRDMMEFKIVHLYFQKIYDLPNDFNFAVYMQECLDHHILELVEVEPSTWLFLVLASLLNIGFFKMVDLIYDDSELDYYDSSSGSHYSSGHSSPSEADYSDYTTDTHHRWLGGGSSYSTSNYGSSYGEGSRDDGLPVFICCAWVLLIWVILLYLCARRSELHLLRKTGASDTHLYEEVLVEIENELLERFDKQKEEGLKFLSLKELQEKIQTLKKQIEYEKQNKGDNRSRATSLIGTISKTPPVKKYKLKNAPPGFAGGGKIRSRAQSAVEAPSLQKSTLKSMFFGEKKLTDIKREFRHHAHTMGDEPSAHSVESSLLIQAQHNLNHADSDSQLTDAKHRELKVEPPKPSQSCQDLYHTTSTCKPTLENPQKWKMQKSAKVFADSLDDMPTSALPKSMRVLDMDRSKKEAFSPKSKISNAPDSSLIDPQRNETKDAPVYDETHFPLTGFHQEAMLRSLDYSMSYFAGSNHGRLATVRQSEGSDDESKFTPPISTKNAKALVVPQNPEASNLASTETTYAENEETATTPVPFESLSYPSKSANESEPGQANTSFGQGRGSLTQEKMREQSFTALLTQEMQRLSLEMTQRKKQIEKGKKYHSGLVNEDLSIYENKALAAAVQRQESVRIAATRRTGRRMSKAFSQTSSSNQNSQFESSFSNLRSPFNKSLSHFSAKPLKTPKSMTIKSMSLLEGNARSPKEGQSLKDKLSSDISDIYFFRSPKLFHKTIDVYLLMACTYGALYVTNYCIVAQDAGFMSPVLVHLFILVPFICMFPVMGKVIKISSLLLAVAEIKPGIIAKVVEETIDTQKMAKRIIKKMKDTIETLGNDEQSKYSRSLNKSTKENLHLFFEEFSHTSAGELTSKEFRFALHSMHVHLSDSRFNRLFKHFDISKSGRLSYHEVSQLVYPEEAQRQFELAQKIGSKVTHKTTRNNSNIKGTI